MYKLIVLPNPAVYVCAHQGCPLPPLHMLSTAHLNPTSQSPYLLGRLIGSSFVTLITVLMVLWPLKMLTDDG